MSIFSGVIKDAVKVGAALKHAMLKAASEVAGVVIPEAEKLQPTMDAIAEAIVPGSSKFVDFGVALLEDVAGVLETGGAAAEQNLAQAGLDTNAIQAIKQLIPSIKALKAAKKV